MKINVKAGGLPSGDVVFFAEKKGKQPHGISPAEFDGEKLSTVLLREKNARHLYVGLGGAPGVTPEVFRQAAGTGVRALLKIGAESLTLDLQGAGEPEVQRAVEGALLAAYKFEVFKMPESRRRNALKSLTVFVTASRLKAAKMAAERGKKIAEATNYVREIGNLPGNVITPVVLAARARDVARKHRLSIRIWDEKALRKEGFGGILAVGQGSANPPRFMVLEYRGGKKGEAPVALVGKAITFDSGGISIKPADRMDEMKFDKMGGCAVLGAMAGIAALKLPLNAVGLIASAENMPGAASYRPGDLVTTYDGKTVEVLNTDAEGRIVLADALAYARKHYQPRWMADFATLTGACIVALGARRAGLFTADEKLEALLKEASRATGELVWPLPMGEEFAEQIQSDVALAKNTGGREGGASTAASFLQLWADKVRWAHLDIAGPAWITKELPYLEKGATGFGVRLILEALEKERKSK
jgi:leucyl aminopeptidase